MDPMFVGMIANVTEPDAVIFTISAGIAKSLQTLGPLGTAWTLVKSKIRKTTNNNKKKINRE